MVASRRPARPSRVVLLGSALLVGLVATGRTPAMMLLAASALVIADMLINARTAPRDGLEPAGWRHDGRLIAWEDMIELLVSGSAGRPPQLRYRDGDRERRLTLDASEVIQERLVVRARFHHVVVRHFTS